MISTKKENLNNIYVPTLSKNNVEFIDNLIQQKKIDTIIEYGSGFSTIYYLNNLQYKNIKFISIETTKYFFCRNIRIIKNLFKIKKIDIKKLFWTQKDYNSFINNKFKPYTEIINGSSRHELWVDNLKYGKFKKIVNFLINKCLLKKDNIFLKVFELLNSLLKLLPQYREYYCTYSFCLNKIRFIYELIPPAMKDQFGESPNRDEFLEKGLKHIDENDKNILIIIDSGPKHYIAEKIINKLVGVNIYLCVATAYRPEYKEVFKKYKGEFSPGNTKLINNYPYYEIHYLENKKYSVEKMNSIISKELWYFNNKIKD